jgi:CDP-glucose 4,6-dehydratase
MENMVNRGASLFGGSYQGRRVLITGHTGFKGSWLAIWLSMMGAHVTCLALEPEGNVNHWALLSDNSDLIENVESHIVDINNLDRLRSVISQANPEIIFHLAAQSLVRQSYASALETWTTNVMGTAHLLEVCRDLSDLKSVVMVTTDKCYENTGKTTSYSEGDPLGGHDPYSASKASMEILISSYRRSFFAENQEVSNKALIASVRAGNVIGGGDWSEDRLIPDAVRSVQSKTSLQIRAPKAVRPWQHVLDCLSGYLMLGQRLLNNESSYADAWNFGPSPDSVRSVEDVLLGLQSTWSDVHWVLDEAYHVHESAHLTLDSSKSHDILNWRPVWEVDQAIEQTALWYKNFYEDQVLNTEVQINNYTEDAQRLGLSWAAV